VVVASLLFLGRSTPPILAVMDGGRKVLLGGIVVAAMSLASCASVGVTTSRSDADPWAGCDGERAALERIEGSLSPFPLAPSPRLRPFSLIEPCSTIRHRVSKAISRLERRIRSASDPEDTQLYEALLTQLKAGVASDAAQVQ
jgi:hypothetical protein